MSDYGDENSDYGDEWLYVEEEYMVADDLAEHAVASPPLPACGDDELEWDRFDYFNDLEYASDGYDDAKFEVHRVKDTQTGQKRKRDTKPVRSNKRLKPAQNTDDIATNPDALAVLGQSPVVWRSQSERGTKPRLLDPNAKPYTLLRDWRDKLPETPQWAHASPPESPVEHTTETEKGKERVSTAPVSPPSEMDVEEEDAQAEMDIDPGALMAALQSRLAEAGGPLSGMDPQQLLEFAMRMAGGKDTGDDIAGEMADAIFDQEEEGEDDDTEAESNLLSWVAKQKNAPQEPSITPNSSDATADRRRPPSPPLSETNHSTKTDQAKVKSATTDNSKASQPKAKRADESKAQTRKSVTTANSKTNQSKAKNTTTESSNTNSRDTRNTRSLKRKADEGDVESASNPTKKRATRSFDAPTAASEARSAPVRTTRSGRGKRP